MKDRAHSAAVLLLAVLSSAPTASAATLPPEYTFQSLDGERVTVHFHQGLEALAREAVTMADAIVAVHTERYDVSLERVHIVLEDSEDEPNGFATVLPYPLLRLRMAAPDGSDEFGNLEGWLRLLLTHELAHLVHLDPARGLQGLGRKVFGRAPFLFPNGATPGWMIEGLATDEETRGTAFGRGRNPDSRMVLRMAALESEFPGEDRADAGLDRWPAGQAAYLFGQGFLADLNDRYGPNTVPRLARTHAGWPIPFLDDVTSMKVTGRSFHTEWKEWAAGVRHAARLQADRIAEYPISPSKALTRRGIRQVGPRFSPDGRRIAYTSSSLTRHRAVRVMTADGEGDRQIARRHGGTTLSWMPDGKALVFDQLEVDRLFTTRYDLYRVDVETGRKTRLTRGLRARYPDVSPGGSAIVFVRREADRTELALLSPDGGDPRDLTRSEPGTQWSHPRWSPKGDRIVASRWTTGGWLDIVLVDPDTGAVTVLLGDRAKDVEPTFGADGVHVFFRSDRGGVSNVFALNLHDGDLRQVTNVLGGAFQPSVRPDGGAIAFAKYTARGYDIHSLPLDALALLPVDPFLDTYPAPQPAVEPTTAEARPYRSWPVMRPRFWTPYAARVSAEWRFGAVTGGADPLLRQAYGLDAHYGEASGRLGFNAFYLYDRFRPQLSLVAENTTETGDGGVQLRTQGLALRSSYPLTRRRDASQSLSLSWRFKRESLAGTREEDDIDLSGVELGWTWSGTRQFPYSISTHEGSRLRVALLQELEALGSDVSLAKGVVDARTYIRGPGASDVLALRLGAGTTFGRPGFRRSYALGGFPQGSLQDIVATNPTVLRGYPDRAFSGRSFVGGNAEYRFALAHPQAGLRSLPVFLRHLHASLFADAAHAWSDDFRLKDVKTSVGAALGADIFLGHVLPVTGTVGLARGLAERGDTQVYFRTGLAF